MINQKDNLLRTDDSAIQEIPIPSIVLEVDDVEMIRMEHGKFFYLGQQIDDAHQVYERFKEWLDAAEHHKTEPEVESSADYESWRFA